MMVYPPGTILQAMHLRERLRLRVPGRFLDVGCGCGWVSALLLQEGWHGIGIDLYAPSVAQAGLQMQPAMVAGRYQVQEADFLDDATLAGEHFDLVISCMVIEHLDETDEARYFSRCRSVLAAGGQAIVLVPSSPAHWGIEDDIAGHYRRYSRASLTNRLMQLGWRPTHLSGLTYPISNWLLALSNYLVRRAESHKLEMDYAQRTRLSGQRQVYMKTDIPAVFGLLMNPLVLWPFHWLQKRFAQHDASLVLYAECTPVAP